MKKMKLFILPVLAVTLAFGQKVTVKVKGSDTVLPLSQKEAETYMKQNKNASITVIGGGSGVGIAALMDGTTDIAQSSRKLKMDEKLKLQEAGKPFKEVLVAYDALAVIINPGNKVNRVIKLTS
jgi:phosphate transport system substrate-binding protein